MAALHGSRRYAAELQFVVFDIPFLAGVDLRPLLWRDRRKRLELVGDAFAPPLVLSPLIEPCPQLALDMASGTLEGIVLKDRESPYKAGGRAGCYKVKDRCWCEREAWRFER